MCQTMVNVAAPQGSDIQKLFNCDFNGTFYNLNSFSNSK